MSQGRSVCAGSSTAGFQEGRPLRMMEGRMEMLSGHDVGMWSVADGISAEI